MRSAIRRTPLVPEIELAIADELTSAWEREPQRAVPYFAIPWVGGQALARFVLDHPELVRGRTLLDVGTGSGLVAIAAARAGAIVRAVDVDERAIAAARDNARGNGVSITFEVFDPLDDHVREEVVTIGDLFYERDLAERVLAFARRQRGVVLVGDPGRAYFPLHSFAELARYEVPASAGVEGREIRAAGVFHLAQAGPVTMTR
jgi:predicted nicotinamide N-methyase